ARHARRREGRGPLRWSKAREAELVERGNVRPGCEPLRRRDSERAYLAGLDHAHGIGDVEPGHVGVAAGDVLEDARAAVLERDVDEVEPAGALGEDFGVDVLV